jgi:hypothetical protein
VHALITNSTRPGRLPAASRHTASQSTPSQPLLQREPHSESAIYPCCGTVASARLLCLDVASHEQCSYSITRKGRLSQPSIRCTIRITEYRILQQVGPPLGRAWSISWQAIYPNNGTDASRESLPRCLLAQQRPEDREFRFSTQTPCSALRF